MSQPPSNVSKDLAKLQTEVGFVRANWGKLSVVVVGALIIGYVLGHILKL